MRGQAHFWEHFVKQVVSACLTASIVYGLDIGLLHGKETIEQDACALLDRRSFCGIDSALVEPEE